MAAVALQGVIRALLQTGPKCIRKKKNKKSSSNISSSSNSNSSNSSSPRHFLPFPSRRKVTQTAQ